MFTTEGGAQTPVLSAVIPSLVGGLLAGVFFSFRRGDGWGVAVGILTAGVLFRVIYPKLREEHARQQNLQPGRPVVATSRRDRLVSLRPNLVRLAVLFAALPVGFVLSVAIGSAWGLLAAMLIALALVTIMHWNGGREQ